MDYRSVASFSVPLAQPKERHRVQGANPSSDLDNHAKTVMDALNGICWKGDNQVDELLVRRLPGREKHTVVAIYRIEEGSLMPWFMTDDKLHSHKKTARATAQSVAPMGLWVLAGSWSADHLTDGFVPDYIAKRYDPNWEEDAAELVRAGFWVVDEVDGESGWRFHQWDERQPTRVKVEAKRAAARERMDRVRSSRKSSSQNVRANNERTDSEPAEHFAGTSRDVRLTPTQPSPTQPTTSLSEAAPRDDVERVCEYLADWVVKNGSKRPTVGKKWRDAARLMIDRDGRTEEQIHKAIDWCQNDEFWRRNIMSMPKLRDQFDRLRLAAQQKPSNVVAIRGNDFADKHAMLARAKQRALELDALEGRA